MIFGYHHESTAELFGILVQKPPEHANNGRRALVFETQ